MYILEDVRMKEVRRKHKQRKPLTREEKDVWNTYKRELRKSGRKGTPRGMRKLTVNSHNLSWTAYKMMEERQGGKCAICGIKPDKQLSVDHDHRCCNSRSSCGACIRELLCSDCNLGLANFKEDPQFMRLAALYIEKHRG